MGLQIEPMRPQDWNEIRTIYLEGITSGHATFETEAPSWDKWDTAHLRECRLIARQGELVLGWAALSPVSSRCAYAGVAEVSVYVAKTDRGGGVGTALLKALIETSEKQGVWSLQAGIFPENAASLALHKKLGFREVGRRERLGKLRGVWRDVILLERRSQCIGVD